MANGSFTGTTGNDKISAKITWSSVANVTGNYSDVTATLTYSRTNSGYTTSGTWNGSITIDGTQTTGSTRVSITYNSNTVAITAKKRVNHNSDGRKSITISATGSISGTSLSSTSVSGTATLDNIARASSFTAPNGTLGSSLTITVTKQNSAYSHSLRYVCGSASGNITSGSVTGTSISFTPPISLASQNTTGTSVSITIYLQTFNGSTPIGSEVSRSITASMPSSVNPTCTISVQDATGLATKFGGSYIQGFSKARVSIASESPKYGATIVSRTTTVGDLSYSGSTITSGVLNTVGTVSIKTTVKDSRGRTGTATSSVTVVAYSIPRVDISVVRCDEDGTENIIGEYCKVTYSAAYTDISGNSKKTFTLRYKQSSQASYTPLTLPMTTASVKNQTKTFQASSGSPYDVELYLEDQISNATVHTSLSTGFVPMHFSSSGKGVAIGKVATGDGFQVGMSAHFDKGLTMDVPIMSGVNLNTLSATGEYVIVDAVNSPVSEVIWVTARGAGDGSGYAVFQDVRTLNGSIYRRIGYIYGTTSEWAAWRRESVVQHGMVQITPTAVDTPTSFSLTFPTAFNGTPHVTATAVSTVPYTGVREVSVTEVTSTGCKIWLTRGNITSTGVNWIAVY